MRDAEVHGARLAYILAARSLSAPNGSRFYWGTMSVAVGGRLIFDPIWLFSGGG
jgi:hypothetical protein